MRRRGLLTVPVLLAAMALGTPAVAHADALKMYRVTIDDTGAGTLGALGVDMGHTGYKRGGGGGQTIFVDLLDSQAAEAEAKGLSLEEVTPGPHVSEAQVEQRLAAAAAQPKSKRAAAGAI